MNMTDSRIDLAKNMIFKRMANRMDTVIKDREEEIKRQSLEIKEKLALKLKNF